MKSTHKDWERILEYAIIPNGNATLFTKRGNPVLTRLKKIFQDFFQKDGLILDGGCGEGTWCFSLEEQGFSTIGIDFVSDSIKYAHRTGTQNGAGAIFLIGDLTRLPLRDSVLGGYISLGVVEHFRLREEINGALKEAARALVPEGRAFFACYGPLVYIRNNLSSVMTGGKIGIYHRYISRSSMEKFLRSGNMKVLKSKYEEGWIGLNNIIDGIIKRTGSKWLREKSYFFWSNLRPVWFLSGNHFWTEKGLD